MKTSFAISALLVNASAQQVNKYELLGRSLVGLFDETGSNQGDEEPVKSQSELPVNRRLLAGLFEETGASQGDEEPVKSPAEEVVNGRRLAGLFEETGAS